METFEEKIFKKFQKGKWEVKTLREIATRFHSGESKITQKSPRNGNFPAITGGDVSNSNISIDNCSVFVDEKLISNKKYIEKGNLMIVNADLCRENVGKACVYCGDEKCLTGNNIFVMQHNQNPKFLSYIFSSAFIQKQLRNKCKRGIRTFLNKKDVENIKIPLPSIEIQNQIVDFLDRFMSLRREMEKEMKRR